MLVGGSGTAASPSISLGYPCKAHASSLLLSTYGFMHASCVQVMRCIPFLRDRSYVSAALLHCAQNQCAWTDIQLRLLVIPTPVPIPGVGDPWATAVPYGSLLLGNL